MRFLFKLFSASLLLCTSVTAGLPPLAVQSSGTTVTPLAYRLNFTGSGQTTTASGGVATITISGGSGGSQAYSINTQSGGTYTFVLADGTNNGNTPLVEFTNSTGIVATVPTNASVAFPIGSQITTVQDGTGNIVFTPSAGVTINSLNSSLGSLGIYSKQILVKTGTNTWDLFGDIGNAFISATCSGCTVTTNGNFKVATFTTSGSFTVTSGYETIHSLVVAGGAGGGGQPSGSGGGAGGYIDTTPGALTGVGTYAVTVGNGGAGGALSSGGTSGTNSVWNGPTVITAIGGGGGGNNGGGSTGLSGGSGGGAQGVSGTAGAGTAGQGNAGGVGAGTSDGGGGGGSSAVGSSGGAPNAGGAGTSNSITGTAVTYAAGGVGCSNTSCSAAGIGPGAANSGNGGGSVFLGTGNVGGSGVVILTWKFQ